MMLLMHISNDSGADFHQTVADMADIPRTQAKTINLGSVSMVWVKQNYRQS